MYGDCVCNGAELILAVSKAATKERKTKAYFVQCIHIWHEMMNKYEMGYKWINKSGFADLLLHKELTGSRHMPLRQKQLIVFWDKLAGCSKQVHFAINIAYFWT